MNEALSSFCLFLTCFLFVRCFLSLLSTFTLLHTDRSPTFCSNWLPWNRSPEENTEEVCEIVGDRCWRESGMVWESFGSILGDLVQMEVKVIWRWLRLVSSRVVIGRRNLRIIRWIFPLLFLLRNSSHVAASDISNTYSDYLWKLLGNWIFYKLIARLIEDW